MLPKPTKESSFTYSNRFAKNQVPAGRRKASKVRGAFLGKEGYSARTETTVNVKGLALVAYLLDQGLLNEAEKVLKREKKSCGANIQR